MLSATPLSSYPPPLFAMDGHQHQIAYVSRDDTIYSDLSSRTDWTYSKRAAEQNDGSVASSSTSRGNWGHKSILGPNFVRRGKASAWGPLHDEWEAEDRARKRIKQAIPVSRSPSPPTLPHLRSPSPPLAAPYPPPSDEHTNYSSFVLDPDIVHSFRSTLLSELERVTADLIEGEATMKRAIGRLWEAAAEDSNLVEEKELLASTVLKTAITKREEIDHMETDLTGNPMLNPIRIHNTFVSPDTDDQSIGPESSQIDQLEQSAIHMKEFQDNGREYVEVLEEIRETLGELKAQKQMVWTKVRENALKELRDITAAEDVV